MKAPLPEDLASRGRKLSTRLAGEQMPLVSFASSGSVKHPSVTSSARSSAGYIEPVGDDGPTDNQELPPVATTAVATHFVKDVPISPNIPVAALRQPIPWSALVIFLILATAVFNGFIAFVDWYTIDAAIALPPDVSVFAVLKNCDVSFTKSTTNTSYVSVQSWLIYMERVHHQKGERLDELPIQWSPGGGTLKIKLALTRRRRYLLCGVRFHLTPDFNFSQLHIRFAPAESYAEVEASTAIRASHAIVFSVLHGVLNLGVVDAPLVDINLGDGALRLDLDDPWWLDSADRGETNSTSDMQGKVIVRSRTAPVHIRSAYPLELKVSQASARKMLVRSPRGTVRNIRGEADESNVAHPTSDDTIAMVEMHLLLDEQENDKKNVLPRHLDIDVDNAALYIDVANYSGFLDPSSIGGGRKNAQGFQMNTSLSTWAGTEHLEEPRLLSWSLERLSGIKPWLDYEPFSPWIVEIAAHRLGRGVWRYLSSSAYLRGDNWFVLFSAGLLQPRQKRVKVHLMGLLCRRRNPLEMTPVIPDEASSPDSPESTSDNPASVTKLKPNSFKIDVLGLTFPEPPGPHSKPTVFEPKFEDDIGGDMSFKDHLRIAEKTPDCAGRFVGRTADIQECEQEILADTFLVLWRALADSRTEATMMVYTDLSTGQGIRFDVGEDAVIQDLITWGDVWFFIIAIVVNIFFSAILAAVGTAKLQEFCGPFLLEDFNSHSVLCNASHRLDHEVARTEENGWSLSVTRAYYPTSGFMLRWNHEPSEPYVRFGVRIRPVDYVDWSSADAGEQAFQEGKGDVVDLSDTRPLRTATTRDVGSVYDGNLMNRRTQENSRDVYLYLPISAAKAAQDVVVHQRQLFLPFKQPGKVRIECRQFYQLRSDLNYRFQLQAINPQGRIVDQSVWSAEVRADAGLMFVDFPLLLLRRFCPVRGSSLEMFVRKHVIKASPHVTRFKLHTFVLEMFTDEGSVKTTTRRRQLRGTMKIRQANTNMGAAEPMSTQANGGSGQRAWGFHTRENRQPTEHLTPFVSQPTAATNMTRIVEDCFVAFQLFLSLSSGPNSDTLEDLTNTSRFLLFHGSPKVVPRRAGGQTLLQLAGDPSQCLTLVQSRISQTYLNVDVSDGFTGRRVAAGSISLQEIFDTWHHAEQALIADPSQFHVRLNHVDTVGQWGRLNFMIVVPDLKEYQKRQNEERLGWKESSLSPSTMSPRKGLLAGKVEDNPQAMVSDIHRAPSNWPHLTSLTHRRPACSTSLPVISPLSSPSHSGTEMQSLLNDYTTCSNPLQGLLAGSGGDMGNRASFWSRTSSSCTPGARQGRRGASAARIAGDHPVPSAFTGSAVRHVWFVKDVPATQYLEGTDMTVFWCWSSAALFMGSFQKSLRQSSESLDTTLTKPDNVYLHLIEHRTNAYLGPIHLGHPIPNTGAYSWTTSVTFPQTTSVRSCYLALSFEPAESGRPLEVACVSNSFIILRCLPLCAFEICYAAFCRTHKLEMEHLSDAKLLESGIHVFEANVKVCLDLRLPLPFEQNAPCIHCPGQCVPSSMSKLVKHVEKPGALTITSSNRAAEGAVNVYKAVSQKLKVVENCQISPDPYWWLHSPDATLLRFDLPFHSLLFRWLSDRLASSSTFARFIVYLLPKSVWNPQSQSAEDAFRKLRYLEFKILPLVFQIVVIFLQLTWFAFLPATVLLAYIQYDRLLSTYMERSHLSTDSHYILDFVFDPSLSFVLSMRFPGPLVVLFCTAWLIFVGASVLFSAVIRERHPRIRRVVQFAGTRIQSLTVFLSLWLCVMFLLWLMLGALINSEGFLPYAVMSASIFFAIYTVSSSFSGAREIVSRFIEENLELLLSIAMNHWFESTGLSKNAVNSLGANGAPKALANQVSGDQKAVQRAHRLRGKIREAREHMLHSYQMGYAGYKVSTGLSMELDENNNRKLHTLRTAVCTYVLQKLTASPGNFFTVVNGNVSGLENETQLPAGTRFASVAEVEMNARKVDTLIHGFEVACLQDGVRYGPRFNNKTDRGALENGSQFSCAIIAVPRYPQPQDVSSETKLALIFSSFDKDDDEHLNEVELTMWQVILKKPEFDDWEETVAYYMRHFDVQIDSQKGMTLEGLANYYTERQNELDKDYIRLFPIVGSDGEQEDLNDVENEAAADEDEDYRASSLSDSDVYDDQSTVRSEDGLDGALSDHEADDDTQDQHLPEFPFSRKQALDSYGEHYRLEQRLVSSLNTQLLQRIYMLVTQAQQERRFNTADFPDSFIAKKIVLTQLTFLSSVFPKAAILGEHITEGALPGDDVNSATAGISLVEGTGTAETGVGGDALQRSRRPLQQGNAQTDTWSTTDTLTELLKCVALEAGQELLSQFQAHYTQMFDPTVVQTGISNFFDNVITQRIQSRARHILNLRLDLRKAELQRSSLEFMHSVVAPRTSFQVWTSLRQYRLFHDADLREKLNDAAASGPLQMQMQISLLVQLLIEAHLLRPEDIEKQFAETVTADGHIREVMLWIPHRRECSQFIASIIESHIGSQASQLSTEDLSTIGVYLISNYLWLDAFLMLLQLMGISLRQDDLPGEAIWIPTDRSDSLVTAASLLCVNSPRCGTEIEVEMLREQANLAKVKKVFNQLSNNTGFLPVDLADEAILLLTDNCLNYAGVIACLQYLDLGGVGKVGTEDVNNVLQELGFPPNAVCYDIEPSSDRKEDVLDWSVYREGTWLTDELTMTFERLTVSSPGFMGKSQMIEFTREISKLFQAPSMGNARRQSSTYSRAGRQTHASINQMTPQLLPAGDIPTSSIDHATVYRENALVTFEMYHRSALKLGLSCNRAQSRLFWIIFSSEVFGDLRQFLPAGELATYTIRLYLQPIAQNYQRLRSDEGLEDALGFRGCLNVMMFRYLIRRLGITLSDKGIRNIWHDLPKDPLEIVYRDAGNDVVVTKYLRLEMDPWGFDPCKGRAVHVDALRRALPRYLCTGLWPEAIIFLFNLHLQLDASEARIDSVLHSFDWRLNRYGLLRPEDVSMAMSEATVEGLTFSMLQEMLIKMRLRLPEQDVKRMFDLMDVNHDHTLDLKELLAGFEMLFQRFVPNQIVDAVGLSYIEQLYVTAAVVGCLLALFCFVGFAFTAFIGLRSAISAAVQSVIALIGAVGLQSGASESIERVQKRMKNRIALIVGEDLDRKLHEQQEAEKTMSLELAAEKKVVQDKRPLEIHYTLPSRYRPSLSDPKPCVTFHPGDEVFLEPAVAGGPAVTNIRWHISPRIPPRTGLSFDSRTGVLSGTIPLIITSGGPSHSRFLPVERLLDNHEERHVPPTVNRMLTSLGSGDIQPLSKLGSKEFLASTSQDRARNQLLASPLPSNHLLSAREERPSFGARQRQPCVSKVPLPRQRSMRMARRTFMIVARNSAGAARCRVTFQIVAYPREQPGRTGVVQQSQQGHRNAMGGAPPMDRRRSYQRSGLEV